MNFLELAQEVRRGVGLQGSGPASVTSASQSELDCVDAVRDAWMDIQNFRTEWNWMRTNATFSTTQSESTYTLTDILGPGYRFRHWIKAGNWYVQYNGQWKPLKYIPYDYFVHREINDTQERVPSTYTVTPWNNSIIMDIPDGVYNIKCEYFKSPQRLAANTDVPECPEHFHIAIKYRAIEKFSTTVVVPEKQQEAAQNYAVIIGQMMREQLEKKKVRTYGIA